MLTKRQKATLEAIKQFQAEHGYTPTVRELAKMLQLSSPSTVFVHMQHLKAKGFISYEPLKAKGFISYEPLKTRTIRVTGFISNNGLELGLLPPLTGR